jgi:protoporphyrinogen IX oxidase
MAFFYIKALHIIFVVTWFSGMFYLGRLFIYNREAQDRNEVERNVLQPQFNLMIKRLLFGITWPSAVLTIVFGLWMLSYFPAVPIWLWIKMSLVVLLFAYHLSLHSIYKAQKSLKFKHSSTQLRMWNEVPTVFLVAIVMLVVVRQALSLVYGLLGLAAFVFLLMMSIRIYKALRKG